MYRDTEFSYREFRCDCYQSVHDGQWCVDFSHQSDGLPMVTVQARKKADAIREAKRQMDERMMTETERLRAKLAASEASRERLVEAASAALGFIENLRVPQTTADAALQVFKGKPVVASLRAAIDAERPKKGE